MKRRARRNRGWIYFVQAGPDGPIKIGWTVDPQTRLAQLQTGSHVRLFILGTIEGSAGGESAIQKQWTEHRIRGEWFHAAPEIIEFIDVHRHRRVTKTELDDIADDDDYWDWLHDRIEIGFGPSCWEPQQ